MRTLLLAGALVMLGVAPAAAAPRPTPAPALKPTTVKGFKEAVKVTTAGKVHRNAIKVIGGTPRTIEVQYSPDGSTWITKSTKLTTRAGSARITMKVAPDRNRWRINVPATADHTAAVTPVKTFAVQEVEEAWTPPPVISASTIEQSKAYARTYILSTYGWGDDQWLALEQLWERESGWNHLAVNKSSGATGIPQALPGDKMATAGADWLTNPQTQIRWGCGYIKGRYGTPKKAWQHFLTENWY